MLLGYPTNLIKVDLVVYDTGHTVITHPHHCSIKKGVPMMSSVT